MDIADLRVALFSGNYNYVRDGANQALNRLVGYLLRQGASVRTYAPVMENPAFPPTGDLVAVPSVPIPFRREYQMPLGLSPSVRRDLVDFAPNVVHVTSPDPAGHRAISWARAYGVPVLASVHTRFETYPRYYHMAFLEPLAVAILRRSGARDLRMICLVAAPEGIRRVRELDAQVPIYTAAVDRQLNERGYILPGLGDAGDRMYGTA